MNHNASFRMKMTTYLQIVQYYEELFEKMEINSIPEIASNLGFSEEIIRHFLKVTYDGPKNDGSFSEIDLKILLCTKFGKGSPYFEDQQNENIQRLIKRRKIAHELKSSIKKGILQRQSNEEIKTGGKHR